MAGSLTEIVVNSEILRAMSSGFLNAQASGMSNTEICSPRESRPSAFKHGWLFFLWTCLQKLSHNFIKPLWNRNSYCKPQHIANSTATNVSSKNVWGFFCSPWCDHMSLSLSRLAGHHLNGNDLGYWNRINQNLKFQWPYPFKLNLSTNGITHTQTDMVLWTLILVHGNFLNEGKFSVTLQPRNQERGTKGRHKRKKEGKSLDIIGCIHKAHHV